MTAFDPPADPIAAIRATFTALKGGLTYGLAPAMNTILGTPLHASTLIPEGQAFVATDPTTGSRAVHIGIPSRNATEAALIVREGLADVLAWLGKPVRPMHLDLAARHYGLERRS